MRLLILLGTSVAPLLCGCSRGCVSQVAVQHFKDSLKTMTQKLGVRMPPLSRLSLNAQCSECCRRALGMVMSPLLALTRSDFYYPGFNESATAGVLRSSSFDLKDPTSPLTIPDSTGSDFDLADYLVAMGLSTDPMTAWMELNADDPTKTVELVVAVLRSGWFDFKIYPSDFDRRAIIIISFRAWGVAGTISVEEPEVDPAGFYVGAMTDYSDYSDDESPATAIGNQIGTTADESMHRYNKLLQIVGCERICLSCWMPWITGWLDDDLNLGVILYIFVFPLERW